MRDFNDNHNCFVCGQANPAGLKLRFSHDMAAQEARAGVIFPSSLQGWEDTVHGGLLATVLDEVMVQAAMGAGITCVTAEIAVKYRKPAKTNTALTAIGRVLENKGRIITAEGSIRDEAGLVYAEATAKLFRIG